MKIIESNSGKIKLVGNDTTRIIAGSFISLIGILAIFNSSTLVSQDHGWIRTLIIIIIGFTFTLLGIYSIATSQSITCEIDKSTGIIQLTYRSLTKKKENKFFINQVTGIEIKELESINHYVYKAYLIISDHRRFPLTNYCSSKYSEMQALSRKVANFLGTTTRFSQSNSPIYFVPPGF